MQLETIVKEIQRLPLSQRFFVMEQTLKSIKDEELTLQTEKFEEPFIDNYTNDKILTSYSNLASVESLAKDWLSAEDNRWDKIL